MRFLLELSADCLTPTSGEKIWFAERIDEKNQEYYQYYRRLSYLRGWLDKTQLVEEPDSGSFRASDGGNRALLERP